MSDSDKLNFLLILNSLSFRYWGKPKWTIEYRGRSYDGSWAMVASLVRALENGIPLLNPQYRARISRADVEKIFRGPVEIPRLRDRWRILREVAQVLLEGFNGDVTRVVTQAGGDALNLLSLLTTLFPSFYDISTYRGQNVYFFKRAQLLISDIYKIFGREAHIRLNNMKHLTACADYKLPWILRKLGVLSYSEELASDVQTGTIIPHGSEREVEIRANTIWAVEYITEKLREDLPHVMAVEVNDYLWLLSQKKRKGDPPYHLTETNAY